VKVGHRQAPNYLNKPHSSWMRFFFASNLSNQFLNNYLARSRWLFSVYDDEAVVV
jgi:hypothetical protein